MKTETRMFRRSDPDFPTTAGARKRLIDAGLVEGEGPLARQTHAAMAPARPTERSPDCGAGYAVVPVPSGPCVPLGETDGGTLHLDLNRLLAGRCLIQGSSGAGKSATLRHLIEEAHDYLTTMIVDPEGEFANLAAHIGAATIRASEIPTDGLTAAALRARHHRLPVHLDLTDLEPDNRIGQGGGFLRRSAGIAAGRLGAHRRRLCDNQAHRRGGMLNEDAPRSEAARDRGLVRYAPAMPLAVETGERRAQFMGVAEDATRTLQIAWHGAVHGRRRVDKSIGLIVSK